jgi:uncharacterized protein (DUF4415 family)
MDDDEDVASRPSSPPPSVISITAPTPTKTGVQQEFVVEDDNAQDGENAEYIDEQHASEVVEQQAEDGEIQSEEEEMVAVQTSEPVQESAADKNVGIVVDDDVVIEESNPDVDDEEVQIEEPKPSTPQEQQPWTIVDADSSKHGMEIVFRNEHGEIEDLPIVEHGLAASIPVVEPSRGADHDQTESESENENEAKQHGASGDVEPSLIGNHSGVDDQNQNQNQDQDQDVEMGNRGELDVAPESHEVEEPQVLSASLSLAMF